MNEIQEAACFHLPAVRIWLCGPFQLEWVHPTTKLASPVLPQDVQGRDRAQAISLLKLLLCQPERQAHRDWIMEQFWPEHSRSVATHRLENVFSRLRKLLVSPSGGESLLHSTRSKKQSGVLYSLSAYPQIWVDTDAATWNVEQAARMERFGDDSFPFWQRAFDLLKRGPLLADEPYATWVNERRESLEGYARQCVHALARLYLAHFGEAGKAEAILLLRTYWQQHKTDEDALRPLLELLGEQERYQEAEEYYQQLLVALRDVGGGENGGPREPDSRTSDIQAYLSTKQIRRERVLIDPMNAIESARAMVVHLSSQKLTTASLNLDPSTGQHTPLELLNSTGAPLSTSSLFQNDIDVLTRLSTILSTPAIVHEREITYFDHQTRLYWQAREETALPATTLYASVIRHIDDINRLLVRSLSPRLRTLLCEIVCRTVLLAGILLYDMGQYAKARQQYQVAWKAATEADSFVLQAIVWGWMSFTWTYAKHDTEALFCVQQAHHFAARTSESTVQAWLGAIEAEIQAHLHHHDACLQSLNRMERAPGTSASQEVSYLFEFNSVLLLGYKGVCLQQLYRKQDPETYRFLQEAKESLEQALASDAPIKRKLYYLSDLAGVYARQGEVETACAYVVQSLPLIMHVGSGSKTIRKHLFQARHLLQPNEHTSPVRALDEQMAPLLIEMQTEEI